MFGYVNYFDFMSKLYLFLLNSPYSEVVVFAMGLFLANVENDSFDNWVDFAISLSVVWDALIMMKIKCTVSFLL